MSWRGKLIRAGIDSDGTSVNLFRSGAKLKISGTTVVSGQQAAEADSAAPTAFTAPAAGSTTVTSNAADDLTTTANALATLVTEVGALTTKVNNILAKLRSYGIIAS